MIEILGIYKNFKKIEVLKNINFNVNNSEIVGLLGENGAGKSTLLRIISTMISPTAGTVHVNEYDLLENSKEVRKNIGVLFGNEVGLYEKLTARENLEYFAKLNSMSDTETKNRINELVEQFKFEDYADKLVGTFSRGMKQKIAIARSVIHNPKVVLFDEPDSGLDFKSAKIVFDFIEFCKENNKSVIFSSHSMENIKLFSDRIVVINKGEVVKIFNVKEYQEKYSNKEINNMLFNLV
ncbi:MAG: sodium export ATP-binding protein natA [Candidatus Paraimprobicoccus trichonymphae]|uniref:Sodium export ATP-binding protein natA n=1 Tax=Candidatus Paraimprobicoccus trichonymphae TaxID=3033793 RepID=A0AA48KZI7_9FIRM|nr:MAG: sodium export ATP-binding protein natA [Candidatus Paraimprobicoccus trichonymphae]